MVAGDLSLRKVEPGDAEILAKWYNNFDIVRYMNPVLRCKKHTKESVENEIKTSNPDFERLFVVYKDGKDKPIGEAGVDDIDLYDKRGEIFFLIGDSEERGKGYGKKIVMLLLDYAFNELKLNSVFATSTVDNRPSISALEKSGFKKVGIQRDYNLIDGKFVDEALFDILQKDYLAQKEKP